MLNASLKKKLLAPLFLALAVVPGAFAANITIIGINGAEILVDKVPRSEQRHYTVKDITKRALEDHGIPAFFGLTPDARHWELLEVSGLKTETLHFSDGSLRALGWCFTLDGKPVNQFADEVMIGKRSEVVWFYCSTSSHVTPKGLDWDRSALPVLSSGAY